ncbi:MAG: dimethylargininase [bacterium]|nr:dimethylargininase [Candidatus Kapabacteria bacterium]
MPKTIAITRMVSDALALCELTFIDRQPINVQRARREHRDYIAILESLGVEVVQLPELPGMPDSVFVEDPAVVIDEVAIITPMGSDARRNEAASIAEALEKYRSLVYLDPPATLEGGDVMMIGRTLYVGRSSRTNAEGARQLARIVDRYGYRVVPVTMHGCLHLKTGCTYIGDKTIVINNNWIDTSAFGEYELIEVHIDEPFGANTLTINEHVIVPSEMESTSKLITARGFDVVTVELSELAKAEAGATCLSIVFDVA